MRLFLGLMVSGILSASPAPVLVELFTSEGCSSCPPADALLMRLQREQPVEGVQVIALSEHVDYWNQLGWTDPFSSGGFSERQRRYAEEFQGEGPYTPQMVVDGKTAFVGSDSRRALQVISAAAKAPKARIDLRCAGDLLEIRADAASDDSDVLFAISENGLSSNVRRGENKGRTMEHDAVA